MYDTLVQLAHGFGVAFQPANLYLGLIGVAVGTLVGVLPGLGPVASMALLLPLTYSLDATGALIMFAGIYYGAMYGVGVLLSTVGQDVVSGMFRFTYNQPTLMDGFDLGPMIMGLFGVSEVLANIASPAERVLVQTRIRDLLPTRKDWAQSVGAIL